MTPKQAQRFFKGVRFLEKHNVPNWAEPYVLGMFLRKWPRKIKN